VGGLPQLVNAPNRPLSARHFGSAWHLGGFKETNLSCSGRVCDPPPVHRTGASNEGSFPCSGRVCDPPPVHGTGASNEGSFPCSGRVCDPPPVHGTGASNEGSFPCSGRVCNPPPVHGTGVSNEGSFPCSGRVCDPPPVYGTGASNEGTKAGTVRRPADIGAWSCACPSGRPQGACPERSRRDRPYQWRRCRHGSAGGRPVVRAGLARQRGQARQPAQVHRIHRAGGHDDRRAALLQALEEHIHGAQV